MRDKVSGEFIASVLSVDKNLYIPAEKIHRPKSRRGESFFRALTYSRLLGM